jgi:site-specific DNA recombinase
VPGTSSYKPIRRPEHEHVKTEIPELRVVPSPLWAAAEARFRRIGTGRRRPQGSGDRGRGMLLSGLLKCGVCGGAMAVVSRRYKKGVGYANLGCSTHSSRGSTICSNNKTVSQRKATHAIIGALRTQLTTPDLVKRFVDGVRGRFERLQRDQTDPTDDLTREVAQADARLRNVTDAMARSGFSEALLAQLKTEEERLSTAKARLAATAATVRPRIIPHPRVIEGYIANLLAVLEKDPTRGRETLAKHMPPLVMTPDARGYRATGGFNLSVWIDDDPAGGPPSPTGLTTVREKSSSPSRNRTCDLAGIARPDDDGPLLEECIRSVDDATEQAPTVLLCAGIARSCGTKRKWACARKPTSLTYRPRSIK